MATGARRNLANEMAKKLQSDVQNGMSKKPDCYNSYEGAITGIVGTLEPLICPIPVKLMAAIMFTGEKPTIGRQIHILRGLMEENKRRNKTRKSR